MSDRLRLPCSSATAVGALTGTFFAAIEGANQATALILISALSQDLPLPPRRHLVRKRRVERRVITVSRFHVNDAALGPMPAHWNEERALSKEDAALLIVATLVGETTVSPRSRAGSFERHRAHP
jgi:hypothetical protein